MNVLLSIKPEFAFQILAGTKKYEYRRVIFRRDGINKVLIYVTSPFCRVMGDFEVGEIFACKPSLLWERTQRHAGVDRKRFFEYFTGVDIGYAIKIKNSRRYKTPLPLKEHFGLPAPQSFLYLDRQPRKSVATSG